MNFIKYDTTEYDFKSIIKTYLDVTDLTEVHLQYPFEKILEFGTDQNQNLHRMFYNKMDSDPEFLALYQKFIMQFIARQFDEDILYQKSPTFRVHQPDNLGVFAFHKDTEYNHNPHSVNFFVPFTRAFDTNTVWKESLPDREDYQPIEADYGDVVIWDGANLRHGSKINETGATRVSMDFRILPSRFYDQAKALSSITQKRQLVIGEYWEKLEAVSVAVGAGSG